LVATTTTFETTCSSLLTIRIKNTSAAAAVQISSLGAVSRAYDSDVMMQYDTCSLCHDTFPVRYGHFPVRREAFPVRYGTFLRAVRGLSPAARHLSRAARLVAAVKSRKFWCGTGTRSYGRTPRS